MKTQVSLLFIGIALMTALAACGSPKLPGEGKITPIAPGSTRASAEQAKSQYRFGVPVTWDAEFKSPPCALDEGAPIFDDALSMAGLDKQGLGFTHSDLLNAPYYLSNTLQQGAPMPWYEKLLEHPEYAGCFEGEVVGAIKHHYLNSKTPISDVIRDAAVLLGADREALRVKTSQRGNFGGAIEVLCYTAGGCDEPIGEIAPELQEAITPLLYAISLGIQAKQRMDSTIGEHHDSEWWRKHGGNLIMKSASEEQPDLQNDEDREYILDKSGARKEMYRTAANIARAVEFTNWPQFAGLTGIEFDFRTEAGWIQIRDSADHIYEDDGKDILLRIDLGGDDIHYDPVAVNTSDKNAVSIDIDLGGDDIRTYISAETNYAGGTLLPYDNYGRLTGSQEYGNVSLSHNCRQGAGLNAIAMLFDFGEGNDRYESLRCSQGYTHGGVGTLFDGGGANTFISEATSQASAQFGIAARVIKGRGENLSSSFSYSQGFGYVQGAGIDISGTGNDINVCDPGDPAQGGIPLYYTPQLPGKGNSSFCQGAGLGHRGEDEEGWKAFLAGGIGIKLDLDGNNAFLASVFGQGVGYWQGVGVLDIQGNGTNVLDVLWYGQGAAAHYAIGMLFRSGEGMDYFNASLKPVAILLGAGHDFSAGIFVNDTGNAALHIPLMSAGAANCNGIGLFVLNRDKNTLISDSKFTSAIANVQCSSAVIPEKYRAQIEDDIVWSVPGGVDTKSAAIMLLVGRDNIYEYPDGDDFPAPQDIGEWTHKRNDSELEYSAGISAPEGETGIHAESNKIK